MTQLELAKIIRLAPWRVAAWNTFMVRSTLWRWIDVQGERGLGIAGEMDDGVDLGEMPGPSARRRG